MLPCDFARQAAQLAAVFIGPLTPSSQVIADRRCAVFEGQLSECDLLPQPPERCQERQAAGEPVGFLLDLQVGRIATAFQQASFDTIGRAVAVDHFVIGGMKQVIIVVGRIGLRIGDSGFFVGRASRRARRFQMRWIPIAFRIGFDEFEESLNETAGAIRRGT